MVAVKNKKSFGPILTTCHSLLALLANSLFAHFIYGCLCVSGHVINHKFYGSHLIASIRVIVCARVGNTCNLIKTNK